MQIGVIIEKGPQDWKIFQQSNGSSDIQLAGKWMLTDQTAGVGVVFARIVREDSGDIVHPWTECEALADQHWQITLRNIPAGGLYRVETCLMCGGNTVIEWGSRGDMIHHLGVGDVYVITGQSNSAGYGKDPVYDPPEIGIHIYKNSGKWDLASHPLNESTATIHEENRENGNPGHSPYLNFARILKRDLGYPIGLIQASLGGSPLSAWNPEENGILYRSMMESIKSQGGKITGVLWYQGCSDTSEEQSNTYLSRFESMVNHLREDMGDMELPVFTVQLNRYVGVMDENVDIYWGKIREAQRQAAKSIPGVYIVPAIDCTLSDAIHNTSSSNMVLGERLAKLALNETYGRKYICKAPDIVQAKSFDPCTVELVFENITQRLYMFEIDVKDLPFTIVDEDGTVGFLMYELKGKDSITIKLDRELKGKSFVHGAFERNPKYVIPIDVDGHLPMLAFYGVEIK